MSTSMVSQATPTTFMEAESVLAQALPGYAPRVGQQALAAAIESALADHKHLVGEGPCGVGKSMAYLIPAILHATRKGGRVMVATATKALQDQLATKDLPLLAEHLGVPFNWAILKGRSNYVCEKRLEIAPLDELPNKADILAAVARPGFNGTRDSLGMELSKSQWAQIASDTDECGHLDCKVAVKSGAWNCWGEIARRRAAESQVVLINHSLLLTDLLALNTWGASFLGTYDVVVIDEAHELESYATSTLGSEIAERGIQNLFSEVEKMVRNMGSAVAETYVTPLVDVRRLTMESFVTLAEVGKGALRIRRATLIEHPILLEWFEAVTRLAQMVTRQAIPGDVPTNQLEAMQSLLRRLRRRLGSLRDNLETILTAEDDDLVRYFEAAPADRPRVSAKLISKPVDVSNYLREWLFAPSWTPDETPQNRPVVVLVSATMSVNGTCDYIAGRLGIDTYSELLVPSPFDFCSQARIYVPNIVDPTDKVAWVRQMINEVRELIVASKGRALVLFTSHAQMEAAVLQLEPVLPYTVLVQGRGPLNQLVEQFKSDEHSVLFGTRSLFQGVDVQGSALSLVIVDKLPFAVPTDPIVEARCEAIEKRGGNAFRDYTIPEMTLPLVQAAGRAIRTTTDQAVIALLDPRLDRKSYGKTVLRSLPQAPRVFSTAAVSEFLAS